MKTATLGHVRKVLELLEEIPREQVQDVLGSGLLSDLLSANIAEVNREEFRKACGLVPFFPAYKIVVDYTKSLAEMISVGHYDWTNNDITVEHFPIKGDGKQEKEVVLFQFNRQMTSEQVIAEMDKAGYRPAKIEELLALGETQPDLQRQFPIVALESVWRDLYGYRSVPCLRRFGSGRNLSLRFLEDGWNGDCRFLAVRK